MEDITLKEIDNNNINLNTINIENNEANEKNKRFIKWFYFGNISVLAGLFYMYIYFKDCNGGLPLGLHILKDVIILTSIILIIFVFAYNIKKRNSIFLSIFMLFTQLCLSFIIFILGLSQTLVGCPNEFNEIDIPTINFKQNSLPVSSTTIINNQ